MEETRVPGHGPGRQHQPLHVARATGHPPERPVGRGEPARRVVRPRTTAGNTRLRLGVPDLVEPGQHTPADRNPACHAVAGRLPAKPGPEGTSGRAALREPVVLRVPPDLDLDLTRRTLFRHPVLELRHQTASHPRPTERQRHGSQQRRLARAVSPGEHRPSGVTAVGAGQGEVDCAGAVEELDVPHDDPADVHGRWRPFVRVWHPILGPWPAPQCRKQAGHGPVSPPCAPRTAPPSPRAPRGRPGPTARR